MLVKEPLKSAVKVEQIFAHALVQGDRQTLLDTLSNEGEFIIQNKYLDDISVDKVTFAKWVLKKRKAVDSLSYYFSQCIGCSLGNPVVLFNEGKFPRKPKDLDEYVNAGLMFVTRNHLIEEIIFCTLFLSATNKCGFEIKREELVQGRMSKKKISHEEAVRQLDEERAKRLSVDLSDCDDMTRSILKRIYSDL